MFLRRYFYCVQHDEAEYILLPGRPPALRLWITCNLLPTCSFQWPNNIVMLIPDEKQAESKSTGRRYTLGCTCFALAEISRKVSRSLLQLGRSMSSITHWYNHLLLSACPHNASCKVVVVVEHMYVYATCWGQCGFISFLLSVTHGLQLQGYRNCSIKLCLSAYVQKN